MDSSDPRMRPLRSGLWLEDATTVGVVPAAGTTLLLLPMESVLTASCERLSGYNAAAVSSDSHCCGFRKTPLAAVITNNPTYRENFHTPKNAPPRGRPSPAQKHPLTNQKINSPKHPVTSQKINSPKHSLTTGSKAETRITIVPPTT